MPSFSYNDGKKTTFESALTLVLEGVQLTLLLEGVQLTLVLEGVRS